MRGNKIIIFFLIALIGTKGNCTETPYFLSFGKNIDYYSDKNTFPGFNQREVKVRYNYVLPVFQSCIGLKSQTSKFALGFWFSPFSFQNYSIVEFKNNITYFSQKSSMSLRSESFFGSIFSADFQLNDKLNWNLNSRIQFNDELRQTSSRITLYNLSTGINYLFSKNLSSNLSYGYTTKANSGIFTLGISYNIDLNFIDNSTTIQPDKTYQF
jgi:hypothetical protein